MADFVADAPGHGTKYGGDEGDKDEYKRRLIEEMIEEMAEDNISLFCLRINNSTDIMFKLFEDIYKEKNPSNARFQIIGYDNYKVNSFSDIVINYAVEIYNNHRNVNNNCLISKETAKDILKTNYNIINTNPDDDILFILGKCSPVLLVQGVFATKLKVEFNCKGLATEERDTTLKNIRIYCGNDVCKDETKPKEEHPLLFSFLEDAFGIEALNDYKYGACLGHISNYFQNEDECPKVNGKKICFYSKYVKVGYYGGTSDTLKESRCGVEGISNVVQTGDLLLDSIISTFVFKAADSFNTISKNLKNKGYKEGFSFGALPNDYRRYLESNNFASEVFRTQVDRLYENTGKPVTIIAHSYGTLLTLTNLLKNQNDTKFMKKIKKFIAMAPPFSGSTKNLKIFLHGLEDFNSNLFDTSIPISLFPIFGQNLMLKNLPAIMQTRPLPIAAQIFIDPSYIELGNALRDRIELEKNCKNTNRPDSEIKSKTEKFDEIFKGYFPSLLDSECSYENNIGGNQETLNRKCYTNIYNVGDCPKLLLNQLLKIQKMLKII